MVNALDPLIRAAQQQVAEGDDLIAKGRALKTEGEIKLNAYKEAKLAIGGGTAATTNPTPSADHTKKFGKVSDKWKSIYAVLFDKHHMRPFGYQDVRAAMEQLGFDAKISSIRSHMQANAKVGMFSRPSEGKFAFAHELVESLGLKKETVKGVNGLSAEQAHDSVQFDFRPSTNLHGAS